MKERPILFSAAMVCAILEGRKTQTRRIIKEQPLPGCIGTYGIGIPFIRGKNGDVRCPYGQPGDRLWVRETWADLTKTHGRRWEKFNPSTKLYQRGVGPFVWYRADGEQPDTGSGTPLSEPWRPSIHMPRWASRINLEVTGVRVEQLQDISEADAVAEGCDNGKSDAAISTGWYERPKAAYRRLWEQINGIGSWNENPWVWVVEFKVLENG